MATVSAIFGADFTRFNEAIDKAEVKLRSFDAGARAVGSSLSKFGNQFSGQKVIQDALAMEKAIREVGGAATLTARELASAGARMAEAIEKMNARGMGANVTQGMRDIAAHAPKATTATDQLKGALSELGKAAAAAFTFEKIISFAKEVGELAGQMQDLSDQTGISTDRLQELNYVAAGAGLNVEDFTKSAEQLAKRLAHGDESAVKAVEALGLSVGKLQTQNADQTLIDIDKAAAGISSTMERNVTFVDLFGKAGGRMARAMQGDLEGLMQGARDAGAVMNTHVIELADEFDDTWTQALISVKAEIASFFGGIKAGYEEIKPYIDGIGEVIAAIAGPLKTAAAIVGGLRDQGESEMSGKYLAQSVTRENKLKDTEAGKAKDKFFGGGALAAPDAAALIDMERSVLKDEKKLNREIEAERKRQIAEADRIEKERQKKIQENFGKKPPTGEELERMLFGFTSEEASEIARENAKLKETFYLPGMGQGIPQRDAQFEDEQGLRVPPAMLMGGLGTHMTEEQRRSYAQAADKASETYSGRFGASLQKNMAPTLVAAITGGGSKKEAAFAVAGQGVADSLFGPKSGLMKKMGEMAAGGGMVGKLIGGIAGAIPMIGPLIGPAIQGVTALVGKLFGSEVKKTNRLRDQAIEAAGGIDKLAEKARQAGTNVDKLLGAKTEDQLKAAMDELNAAFEKQQAILDKYGITWRDFEGAAKVTKIGEEIKALTGDYEALTRAGLTREAAALKVRDAYVELASAAVGAGGEIPPALAPVLKQLAEMGKLTEAQVSSLLGLTSAATVDFQRMEDVAKKYGIELSALGGQFQSAKIGSAANALIEDFNFLIDSGADVNGVIAGMGDELNKVVQQAMEFGIALPASMRPVLERMIEQGTLTDNAGDALEDLSGINFAQPIEQGIADLIAKLDELIGKIGEVGGAFGGLDFPEAPEYQYGTGGGHKPPEAYGDPYAPVLGYAKGTGGRFLDFGQGTPVMLHGREKVVTEGESEATSATMGALVSSMNAMQTGMIRAIRENALAVRDQTLLALGRT